MPWKMLIGAAANTATGLVNNALSQGNAREQREWTEKMWSKENAYNAPAAMAARMRSAGLNPFTMTGAQPAGSVGNGATAETIPLQSPLDAFKTISEVENINASTNKIETESEKLLKDMSILDVLYEKELLTKEEYELRLEKLKESWEKYNPYTLDAEKTIAETGELKSRMSLNEANAVLADSQKQTEESLREARKTILEKDADVADALANLYNVTSIAKKHETKREDAMLSYRQNATAALSRLHLDESDLTELQAEWQDIENRFYKGEMSEDEVNVAIDKWFERVGNVVGVSLAFIPKLGRKLRGKGKK